MDIVKKIIQNNYDAGRGDDVKMFVMHTTQGTGSCHDWFNRPNLQPWEKCSAHFCVLLNGVVEQYVELADTAFHAGDGYINMQSIGIEHEDRGNFNDSVRTPEQYESSAQLLAYLHGLYPQIPIQYIDDKNSKWSWGVRPHRNFVNVACPAGLDVQRIVNRANEIIKAQATVNSTPTPEAPSTPLEIPQTDIKPDSQGVQNNTNLNNQTNMEVPAPVVSSVTVETLSDRLQNAISYSLPVQTFTAALVVLVNWKYPMPIEVMSALTVVIAIAINLLYSAVRFLSSKYIK